MQNVQEVLQASDSNRSTVDSLVAELESAKLRQRGLTRALRTVCTLMTAE